MHTVHVDARNMFVAALVGLVVLAGALFAFVPTASANREDCPAGRICLWNGPTFGEERAFFEASETGCRPLNNINPRSGWNRTSRTAEFPLSRTIGPGAEFSNIFPWGGEVCIR
jgi:hypothetical protein